MKTILYPFVFLAVVAVIISGCEDDAGFDPIPPPTDAPPAYVHFSLSATPWEQDSLKAVYVAFSEITLKGTEGLDWTAKLDSTRVYNLLDLDETAVYLGMDTVDAGQYTDYVLKMRSFVLVPANGDEVVEVGYKAELCHYPPGNDPNVQTLSIGACAVAAHLKHGDTPGNCATNGYSVGNRIFNHIIYKNDSIAPLFVRKELTIAGTLQVNIPEGDDSDVILTVDPSESVKVLATEPQGDCGFLFAFEPEFEVTVLPRVGGIDGIYDGSLSAGRNYFVYAYKAETYQKSEENIRNPFPNAIAKAELDDQKRFVFNDIKAGNYDLILAEFQGTRFRKVVKRENGIEVLANAIVPVSIYDK